MKRWVKIVIVIGIIVLLIGGIVVLQANGYLENFTWETLTMWIAGLAAPIKLLFDAFGDDEEDDILKKHEDIQKAEEDHRKKMDEVIHDKERRISDLDREVEAIDAKVKLLDERKRKVDQKVANMSDEEKIDEAQSLWGK